MKILKVIGIVVGVIVLLGFLTLGTYGIMKNPNIPASIKFFILTD